MQLQLDFIASKREVFKNFVERLKALGYMAKKVNYTGCATVFSLGEKRISICPGIDSLIVSEYEIKPQTWFNPPAIGLHRHPDDHMEGEFKSSWKWVKSYRLT